MAIYFSGFVSLGPSSVNLDYLCILKLCILNSDAATLHALWIRVSKNQTRHVNKYKTDKLSIHSSPNSKQQKRCLKKLCLVLSYIYIIYLFYALIPFIEHFLKQRRFIYYYIYIYIIYIYYMLYYSVILYYIYYSVYIYTLSLCLYIYIYIYIYIYQYIERRCFRKCSMKGIRA